MTESYKLIKNNGEELEFNNGKFYLQNLTNFGNPNINYTTESAFFQDGSTITNFVAEPRILNFAFLGNNEGITKRTDYWDLRREILNFISPINGPMTFQLTLDNNVVYELTNVYATNGLSMEGNTFNTNRNDGRIEESLRLTAFDPIWRVSPIESTGSIIPSPNEQLVFPFEFPISFGSAGTIFDETITYNGSWRSYPKITIDGPYNTAVLTNKYNGVQISLIRSIATGEQRIIDLTNPVTGFSVINGNGENKIGEIGLTTNFTQFYFSPDTTNGIDAVLNGGTQLDTRITVEYYEKYLGI